MLHYVIYYVYWRHIDYIYNGVLLSSPSFDTLAEDLFFPLHLSKDT